MTQTTIPQSSVSFAEIADKVGTSRARVAGAISIGILHSTGTGAADRANYEADLQQYGTDGLRDRINTAAARRDPVASSITLVLAGLSAVAAVALFIPEAVNAWL